jgi:putative membrane protein
MSKTAWMVVILLALVLVVALGAGILLPLGCGSRYGYGYGGMMGPWMTLAPALRSGASAGVGGFGIFGILGGLLLLVLLVGGAVWLFQFASRDRGVFTGPPGETPLEILKRRYAKGEITKEQYESMRRDLGA